MFKIQIYYTFNFDWMRNLGKLCYIHQVFFPTSLLYK